MPTQVSEPLLLSHRFTAFIHFLKQHNFSVNTSSSLDAMQIVAALGLDKPIVVKNGLKICFCQNKTQWAKFDSHFEVFWFGHESDDNTAISEHKQDNDAQSSRLVGLAGTSHENAIQQAVIGAGDYSALSLADFRFMFDELEKRHIEQQITELAERCKKQHSRRARVAHNGSQLSFSKTLRKSLRYQGSPFELVRLKKQKKLPAFVLLLDISQSMDVYARLFLRFTRQLLSLFEHSHAFAFNVELINLGKGFHDLRESDFENTINNASSGWVGGTRIAGSLNTFNDHYAPKLLKTNTKVVIFSDGYDTDTPAELELVVQHLSRQCREIIWVNPLLGRLPSDTIDTRMDAIQPLLAHYISAHNLVTLKQFQQKLLY